LTEFLHPFIYPITIEIGGWDYKIKAGFTKFVSRYGYGVVGQKGFFEHNGPERVGTVVAADIGIPLYYFNILRD
jgi:hypothetical protein